MNIKNLSDFLKWAQMLGLFVAATAFGVLGYIDENPARFMIWLACLYFIVEQFKKIGSEK